MTADELTRRLDTETVVWLDADEWCDLRTTFEQVGRHPTFIAGDLVLVRDSAGLAAVEEPSSTERVLRRLPDPETAQRFVADRLDAYERMWDGCGCRVHYGG